MVAKPSPRVQEALKQLVAWLLQRRLTVVLEPQARSLDLFFQCCGASGRSPDPDVCSPISDGELKTGDSS